MIVSPAGGQPSWCHASTTAKGLVQTGRCGREYALPLLLCWVLSALSLCRTVLPQGYCVRCRFLKGAAAASVHDAGKSGEDAPPKRNVCSPCESLGHLDLPPIVACVHHHTCDLICLCFRRLSGRCSRRACCRRARLLQAMDRAVMERAQCLQSSHKPYHPPPIAAI